MPRLGFNFFGELMNFDSLLSQWNNNFHDSDEADGKMYGNHDVHSSDKVDGHVRIDDDDAGLPLAEWLWVKTAECRKKVLDTSFIQGLKNGTLDPITFGVYNFQDVVYCYKASRAQKIAVKKANGNMKQFLEGSIKAYEDYSSYLFTQWRVASPDAVNLGSSLSRYIDYRFEVAEEMEPIYTALSLLPCERLWPWIGEQIKGSVNTFGVYKAWIHGSLAGDDYKKLETFINLHHNYLDKSKALKVYERCMVGEYEFFNSP